jgi:CheY-like chemotaxis protein
MSEEDKKTILLAEDEENDALLLELALHHAAISNPLNLVRNGREAIEYLKGSGAFADRTRYPLPGLMLLDLNMPVLGGFDVLAWRMKQCSLPRFPIVVLSSSNLKADVHEAISLGADGYCIKPAGMEYLTRAVRELYDRWLKPAQPAGSVAALQPRDIRRRSLMAAARAAEEPFSASPRVIQPSSLPASTRAMRRAPQET